MWRRSSLIAIDKCTHCTHCTSQNFGSENVLNCWENVGRAYIFTKDSLSRMHWHQRSPMYHKYDLKSSNKPFPCWHLWSCHFMPSCIIIILYHCIAYSMNVHICIQFTHILTNFTKIPKRKLSNIHIVYYPSFILK